MRRPLALLATCGLLGVSAVVAGSAAPALAASFFVQLSASPSTLAVGGTTTLTATTSSDVGPTRWFIDIFDATTGTRLKACSSGTTCTTTATSNVATTHQFVAFVALANTTLPPSDIQGTSNGAWVTWTNSPLRVTLSGPEVDIEANGPGSYVATASADVRTTGYTIAIYDETTGQLVIFCTVGSTCPMTFTPSVDGDELVAYLETFIEVTSQFYPPPPNTIVASSNVLLTRGFIG